MTTLIKVVTLIRTDPQAERVRHGDISWINPKFLDTKKGKVKLCKKLLEHGFSVNEKNVQKETILHLCCKEGNKEMAEILLDHGASLYEVDSSHETPLHKEWVHFKKVYHLYRM